jgi:hypothetical protein
LVAIVCEIVMFASSWSVNRPVGSPVRSAPTWSAVGKITPLISPLAIPLIPPGPVGKPAAAVETKLALVKFTDGKLSNVSVIVSPVGMAPEMTSRIELTFP